MTSSSSASLPSWASKAVDATISKEDDFVTSTRQSANLFRIECARHWQQRLHEAQRRAWTEAVKHMMISEKTTLGAASSTASSNSLAPLQQYYSINPSVDDPSILEELLPVTAISPAPVCRSDRQALAEAVWDSLRGQGCASLWLPRLFPSLHATLHFLARQCLHNLPEETRPQEQPSASTTMMRYFRKHETRRNTSMKLMILWWASRTKSYDSMAIVLEDPGGFQQTKVWNDFVQTLQEMRKNYGLPLSLIVVGSVSSIQQGRDLQLRHVQLARRVWLEKFWGNLLHERSSQQQTTAPFPFCKMHDLLRVVDHYRLEHQSFAKLCTELNHSILSSYSHPSKIAWDALELHPSFLAWFCVHGTAKKWLSVASGSSKYVSLEQCQRLQEELNWWWKWQRQLLPILMEPAHDDRSGESLLKPLAKILAEVKGGHDEESATLPVELELYLDRAGVRKIVEASSKTTAAAKQQALTLLYELIVLVGASDAEEKSHPPGETIPVCSRQEQKEGLDRLVFELFEFCLDSMQSLVTKWNETNPLYKKKTDADTKSQTTTTMMHSCYHRREMVEGLESPARQLYGLLQDRLSISRDEWLYHFGGSTIDFVQGVWTLVLAGLVQRKIKRQGTSTTIFYEKVSVVWC